VRRSIRLNPGPVRPIIEAAPGPGAGGDLEEGGIGMTNPRRVYFYAIRLAGLMVVDPYLSD
jgi:hypothetical protein